MNIKGAIFDMDGLLFDTESVYQQTWQKIARERGIELDNRFPQAVSGTNGSYMCRVIEEYYHVSDGTVIIEQCMGRIRKKLSDYVPIKKGVHEILEFFREQGVKMAVASSSNLEQIESNLQKSGIRRYFTEVVSGIQVRHGKPAPDIFLFATRQIGYAPETCFVFEDSENGIRAGYAAGCITIMVPDLIEASADIFPYCTKICPDLLHAVKEADRIMHNECSCPVRSSIL